MNLRLNIARLALFAVAAFTLPAASLADAGTVAPAEPLAALASQPCPAPNHGKLDLAEATQTDCCKGHKGVCGCRAGKIVCCDGSASPSCTCHGDDGFLE